MDIQLEWTRRGLDLKKVREDIAALENPPSAATTAAAAKPVDLPAKPSRSKQGFDYYDGIGEGAGGRRIKSARVDSADGCMTVCRNTNGCVGAFYLGFKGLAANGVQVENCSIMGAIGTLSEASATGQAYIAKAGN